MNQSATINSNNGAWTAFCRLITLSWRWRHAPRTTVHTTITNWTLLVTGDKECQISYQMSFGWSRTFIFRVINWSSPGTVKFPTFLRLFVALLPRLQLAVQNVVCRWCLCGMCHVGISKFISSCWRWRLFARSGRSGRSGRRVSVSTAFSGRLPGARRVLPGSGTFWPDARYSGPPACASIDRCWSYTWAANTS